MHNSGHWTLDGCLINQFEQHIRAISGWPLGSTKRHSDIVMTNIIGNAIDSDDINGDQSIYDYGKDKVHQVEKWDISTRLYEKGSEKLSFFLLIKTHRLITSYRPCRPCRPCRPYLA